MADDFGITLKNSDDRIITRGVEDTYVYWGKVRASNSANAGVLSIFNISRNVPVILFKAYDNYDDSTSWVEGSHNYPAVTYFNYGLGRYDENSNAKVSLTRNHNRSGQTYVMYVYVFVPARYVPKRESHGIDIYNSANKRMFTTERPFLKISALLKSVGINTTVLTGTLSSRPATIDTLGFTGVYGACPVFVKDKLTRELVKNWFPWPSAMQNLTITHPVIDRNFYDKFSSLGDWSNSVQQ